MIKSPLDTKEKTSIIESISTRKIIQAYKTSLNLDVSRFFSNVAQIDIVECEETKYRFYHPTSVAGDGPFYEQLQEWEPYYEPWKWEHAQAIKGISPNSKLLEIGSGAGGFLRKMTTDGFDVTGLELNEKTAQSCQQEGLKLYNQTIQEHALIHPNTYDVVCSFQVLEHIADVKSFLEASIKCLKPNGKMIISVPNNNSYIQYEFNALNSPPHHIGLWTQESLKNICNIFPIKHEATFFSPYQSHAAFCKGNIIRHWKRKRPYLPYKFYLFCYPFIKPFFSPEKTGLTIQVHYSK
jgi:2-polyprenyl-3-methyl-5-hydroxy-6-metoxy-1,4-benzoquinol methylase